MTSESASPITKPLDGAPAGKLAGRAAAIAEVFIAFAAVHFAYRSFKHFTELGRAEGTAGLNFSPGIAMTLFTIVILLVCRRNFEQYGLSVAQWRYNLNVGLVWGILYVAAAGLVIRLAGIDFDPLHPPDIKRSLVATLGELINASLVLWLLTRERTLLRWLSPSISIPVLLLLLSVPIMLAIRFHRPPFSVLGDVAWNFFCAGFGEEIFFRGYIQSRINWAFGRPWRILGERFGLGLIISSALFGLIHVLNTVDYFNGRYDFAWLWWLPNFASGLFFGLLREKTNSILAGSIIHGLGDVFAKVPAVLPR